MSRPLVEIASRVSQAEDELCRTPQRQPRLAELAQALKISEEDLVKAMELYGCYQPLHLEQQREMADGSESMALEEMLGSPNKDMEAVVEYTPLREAISMLEERLQKVIWLRFFEDQTQHQVGRALGISQMHTSRLERRALQQLRAALRAS